MDISGVMNLHELTMNHKLQEKFENQYKKEHAKDQVAATKTAEMAEVNSENNNSDPKALSNTPLAQADPQAQTIRVEREVDVQGTKDTQGQPAGQNGDAKNLKTDHFIDIIT